MLNITTIGMTLIFVLGLAKKGASNNDEKDAPFWEQFTLSGTRSLEWISNGFEGTVKKVYFGNVAYFYNHFDFANAMKYIENLSLDSTVCMMECTDVDRMVLCHQSGAIKELMKTLLLEASKENIAVSGLCEIYLDETGKTEVQTAEFARPVWMQFQLKKEGKKSRYIINL